MTATYEKIDQKRLEIDQQRLGLDVARLALDIHVHGVHGGGDSVFDTAQKIQDFTKGEL